MPIAGEPLNPEVFNQFYKATGLKLMEGFGQSETTLVLFNPIGTEPKPGSTGCRPQPIRWIWSTGNGNSVPTGEVGEIVIRTPGKKPAGLFNGYYLEKSALTVCGAMIFITPAILPGGMRMAIFGISVEPMILSNLLVTALGRLKLKAC